MKYDLIIRDLTAKQVTSLMNSVENETEITSVRVGGGSDPVAVSNLVASLVDQDDVESLLNDSTDQLLKTGKTGELDSTGLPWDERIHSGSKKMNADGKWKLRKNVDEALVKSVEHEHKSALSANLTAAAPGFLQPSAAVPVAAPVTYVAPVAAPAPIMAQPQPAPTRDFAGLMLQISKLFATKTITPDYPATIVNRVNHGFGTKIATLTDVANDPRMVEYSWQCLEVDGRAA